MTEMKRCSKCGEEKSATLEAFAAEKRRKCGLASWCRECQKADAKKRRDADPEKSRQGALAYYERNKEAAQKRMRAAYRARMADPEKAQQERERTRLKAQQERAMNPEKARDKVRRSRAARIEFVRAQNRKAKQAAYAKAPEAFKARSAAQRAQRLNAPGTHTGENLRQAFARQKGLCIYCDARVGQGRPWHADHFIPISKGGSNAPENIVIACEPCNRSKYNKMPWEWMPERFSPPQAE